MFNTIKKITRSICAKIVAFILLASVAGGANAGILDWFGGRGEASRAINPHSLAFIGADGSLFASNNDIDDNVVIVNDNFLLASKTPAKSISYGVGSKISAKELYVLISGYSSTPDQTDSSPFITANGTYVHDGVVAANFLPFGTRIKIPGYFGNKIFTVHDRMNKRYWQKIDVWFPDRQSAIEFGLRTLKIQILES